jgi:RNA recognition motif-containing protein
MYRPPSTSKLQLRGADGDEADTSEEDPTLPSAERKVTDASVRKLLNPLSRDQLINVLVKVGLHDEAVLNEIRHASETDPSRTKLFVRELAWATTSEKLRSVFEQYGEIEEAVVIKDRHTQKSRGFGFVRYKTAAAASRALQEPSKEIDGRTTQCNLASAGNPFKRQPVGSPPRGPSWGLTTATPLRGSSGSSGWQTHDSWLPAHPHEIPSQPPRWSTTPRFGPRASFPPGPGAYVFTPNHPHRFENNTSHTTSSETSPTFNPSGGSASSGSSGGGYNKSNYPSNQNILGYPGGTPVLTVNTGPHTGSGGSYSNSPSQSRTTTQLPLSPTQFQASYSPTYPTTGTQYSQPY